MPTINRRPIKQKQVPKATPSDAASFYNSKAWSRLRPVYRAEHPLCECCLQHGRVQPMTDIHHKKPFMQGTTEEERWSLFLSISNLISLCETCHHAVHTKIERHNLSFCDELTDKEWSEAHGL